MFSKIAVALVSFSALVSAAPVRLTAKGLVTRTQSFSLSGYGGHDSLHGFDDFYGEHNFDGSHNEHHEVLVNESHLVCHTRQIEIIQQRLVVLQELAKKIITEQICEVETQTVVLEQWRSSIRGFHYDVHRHEGSRPGYDSHIVSHYNDMFENDGSLSTHDLGFHGSDVGSSYVYPSGSNWVDSSSPSSVESAYQAASAARDGTSALPPIPSDNSATSAPIDDAAAPEDSASADNTAPPADSASADNTAAPAAAPAAPAPAAAAAPAAAPPASK